MTYWLERTELLIGSERLETLCKKHVMVIGLGGVGSYAAEFLGRAGIGTLTIIDGDVVDVTNKNRQLPALTSTVGKSKAALMSERLLDINPELQLNTLQEFLTPERMNSLITEVSPDYVLDCIDSVKPKLRLIQICKAADVPIISSMGAGGKQDPARVCVADISKTKYCKFAHHIRKCLRRTGIKRGLSVVFSDEPEPREALRMTEGTLYKRSFYGTISYMPALFGLYMAAEVIKQLSNPAAAISETQKDANN